MTVHLSFFPRSLPDETLYSRISRFHILSGQNSEVTFLQLFDSNPFILSDIVPRHLGVLASRLPGIGSANMGTILLENTLMPLFLPFLSQLKSDDSIELDIILRICIGHFRGKAELRQSNMKLCVSCLIDDATFGSPYWHRSHQLKGVGVCYRHGHVLISECSNCNEPFRMRHGLLGVPWVACKCGVGIKDTPQLKVAASIEEQEFALFAHKQLNGNSVAMSSIVLGGIFSQEIQDQVRKRHRPMINRKMLVDTLIARLDNEFLPYVDIAYAAGFLISNVRLLDADIANEPEEEN